MPKSSRKKSARATAKPSRESQGKSPQAKTLPPNASLENLRKQAKTLVKAVCANEPEALARLQAFDWHPGTAKDRVVRRRREVARRVGLDTRHPSNTFSLSDAQYVIARSYGFASWSKLKQHVEVMQEYSALPVDLKAADNSASLVDRFIALACLNYANDHVSRHVQARELLTTSPSLPQENIFAAATVGDITAVKQMLRKHPALAKTRGGPYRWEPLLYATYSRLNSEAKEHSTLEATRLLLEHGADPNAGFLWDGHYLFTALTGVFGEGEAGPLHQPQHQFCQDLAGLLLRAGADPNDGQTLYNRMFTGGIKHLELLFEFGLGKRGDGVWFRRLGSRLDSPAEMLQQQMAWAAKYNQLERMRLLIQRGVDVNGLDKRFNKTPYELALLSGNVEMAEYLVSHGARKTRLSDLDAFSAACLNADNGRAKTLLRRNPALLNQLGIERAELLNLAAESDKREAVRLMHELGFDLNERKRTTALHLAAIGGRLEMVKLLIELGGDPSVRDEEFNATPLGWAEYGQQTEVVEFLRHIDSEKP